MVNNAKWVDIPGVNGGKTLVTGDARFDIAPDPTAGLDGMPPNMGEFSIPHIFSFQSIYGTMAKVYRASDEAIKHGYDNARFMRNDVTVMECVEMRQRAGCLTDWSIEPEDARNSEHLALCDAMTKIVKKIPRFVQYQENLLHATWYGKYGIEHRWGSRLIGHDMRKLPVQWLPVNGDKIVFRFDDLSGDFRPDQIGIRVATHFNPKNYRKGKVMPTDFGMAYFLDSWERSQLALHKYRIEDGEFEEPSNAGRVHGVGIRSVIYWTWYQKQETLAYLMEYLERSAAGVEIWYYPMGNASAEAATRKAAEERIGNGRNIILVPKPQGDDAAYYDVQRIEPSMAGASELKSIITEYFGHSIKRYILGQTLTSEAASTGLGSGVADLHLDTFMQIIRYDTMLLEETIDTELLQPLLAYNFPKFAHVEINFRKHLTEPDAEQQLNALKMAYEMGLRLDAQTLRDLIGAAKPEADAEVLDKMAQMKAEQDAQAQQQQGGMPPGMMPPGGAAPGQETAPPTPSANATAVEQAEYTAVAPGEGGDRHLLLSHDSPVEQYKKFKAAVGQKSLDWQEDEHPRDPDGKFTDGSGGGRDTNFTRGSTEPSNDEKTAPPKVETAQVDHKDHVAAAAEWKEKATKSQWFKSWFGDWENKAAESSKVVDGDGKPQENSHVLDENGQPLMVYHGTATGGFKQFDKSKLSNPDSLLYGPGFYFTANESIAEEYADNDPSVRLSPSEMDKFSDRFAELLPDGYVVQVLPVSHEMNRAWGQPRIVVAKSDSKKQSDIITIATGSHDKPGHWQIATGIQDRHDAYSAQHGTKEAFDYLKSIVPEPEVKKVYLNIRKPFDAENDSIAIEDIPDDSPILTSHKFGNELTDYRSEHKSLTAKVSDARAKEKDVIDNMLRKRYGWDDQKVKELRQRAWFIDGEEGYWAQHAASAQMDAENNESLLAHNRRHWTYDNLRKDYNKDTITELLKAAGHDGITHTGGKVTGNKEHRVWIAFEPEQIKSIDNRGTFDPEEASIDYAAGWSESKHARDGDGQFAPLDLTGWDKPIVQPQSLKGQQALFEEIDPARVGSTPKAAAKPKRDPRQAELFSRAGRIRAAVKKRLTRV